MRKLPSTPLKAVILVGGEGTRLRPLTYITPKSMLPVINRPFLEHMIAYLKKHQVEDIILTISYLPEVIHDYFDDGSNAGVRLIYTMEEIPLGTAGAVKNTERYLNSTFLVLNGDIFSNLDLGEVVAFHQEKGAKATIALTWVDNPSAFGVVETNSDRRVRRFIEKPSPGQATSHWINAGVYVLEPEVLKHVPANSPYMFEKGLFPRLLELDQPIYGYPFRGYWLDMGTPQKYLDLNFDLLLLKAKSALINNPSQDGVYCERDVLIHSSAKVVGPVVIGSRCKIDQKTYIKGPVVIGPDCQIGEKAKLEKSILWNGVEVAAGAILKQSVASSNTSIRKNAEVLNCIVTPDRTEFTQL